MVPSSHIQTTLITAKSQQGNLRGISSVYYLSHYFVTGVLICMLPYKNVCWAVVSRKGTEFTLLQLSRGTLRERSRFACNKRKMHLKQSYKMSCLSRHRGCPCTYVRCTETCHRIELYWTVKLQRLHSASDW